ncbi:MAG: hypothetical protein PHD58_05270 [Anaerolineales bacterium]|nr:hypothetical protein [Anaerolineales bacterium]
MISEAEIRRLAARWQADPMILDLDYSLGWFLAALAAAPGASLDVSLFEKRREEYELDWKRRLDYLIPDSAAVTFGEAWQSTIDVIRQVQDLTRA